MLASIVGDCRNSEQLRFERARNAHEGFNRISGWIKITSVYGERRKVEGRMNETRVFADGYRGVFQRQ